jgi:predicted DNA-binding transcriptional regulator YafY
LPSHTTRHTIARQWQLLNLLPHRHPGMSATQLQAALARIGHKTTKRTVERDLNELATLFPLHCNAKGMPYGWHWQPGLNLDDVRPLHLNDLASVQPVQLHAWVNDALARRLRQQPLAEDMRLDSLPEGGAQLTATVLDNTALMGWLLSHAGAIRLLAPEALRSAMLEHLRQSLALHDGHS